jgi:hypothetical protein
MTPFPKRLEGAGRRVLPNPRLQRTRLRAPLSRKPLCDHSE